MSKPRATKIAARVERVAGDPAVRVARVSDGTTWPWPFEEDSTPSLSHRIRYSAEVRPLTRSEQLYLAEVFDAYRALLANSSCNESLAALRRHVREQQ